MTYVLVTDAGEVDVRPETPTVETLLELTGDGTPELVRLRTGDRMVAWVNDDWISRVRRGEFQINRTASVVHMTTGGELVPLGGPVVFTALTTDDGQYLPAALDEEVEQALTTVATDVSIVLAGHPEAASFQEDDELDAELRDSLARQITEAGREVETLPLAPLDGGWDEEKEAARVAEAAREALAGLRAQGMPELMIELICAMNNVPYTPPAGGVPGKSDLVETLLEQEDAEPRKDV